MTSGDQIDCVEFLSANRTAYVDAYIAALRNEIAFDIDAYRALELSPDRFGGLPRIFRLWPRVKRYPGSAALFGRLLAGLWPRGLGLAFFAGASAKLAISRAGKKVSDGGPSRSSNDLYMLLSGIALNSIVRAIPEPAGVAIAHFVGAELASATKLCVFTPAGILTLREIAAALRLAVVADRAACREPDIARWPLQGYSGFSWVCMAMCLAKLPARRIYMAAHYDRWAILIDRHCALLKRLGDDRRPSPELHLVQHGIEAVRVLPTQLTAVTHLHLYNEKEKHVFREFILDRACGEQASVELVAPTISLTPLPEPVPGRRSLLVIGHPEFDRVQISIIEQVSQTAPDLTIIYKPHPTAGKTDPAIAARVTVWSERASFPEADMVMSYPSTLALQYELAGKPVLVHEHAVDASAVAAFLATHAVSLDRN